VQKVIDSLKPGKSAGQNGITNEHIMFGGSHIVVHLCLLFTAMLRHSFVPSSFQFGVLLGLPIPKDKHGDLSNLVGLLLLQRFAGYLNLLCWPNMVMSYMVIVYSTVSRKIAAVQCSHALFSFTVSVRFYNKRGSKVYCAFLDVSKAFVKC